jgi:hypothetical protein
MSTGFEFLTIYSEICLGTTAFFAIVATLRQTLGESLTEYQYLITRFFIDTGLQLILVSIIGLAIFSTDLDGGIAWHAMAYMIIVANGFYTPYYLTKRRKVDAPSNIIALLVSALIVLTWINLVMAVFELSQISVQIAVMLSMVTIFACMIAVFLIFIGSFMKIGEVESSD